MTKKEKRRKYRVKRRKYFRNVKPPEEKVHREIVEADEEDTMEELFGYSEDELSMMHAGFTVKWPIS